MDLNDARDLIHATITTEANGRRVANPEWDLRAVALNHLLRDS